MRDKCIPYAESHQSRLFGTARKIFRHCAARTAHEGMLFNAHKQLMAFAEVIQQACIQRLDESHVKKLGISFFCNVCQPVEGSAKGEEGGFCIRGKAQRPRFANCQSLAFCSLVRGCRVWSCLAPWIADCGRSRKLIGSLQKGFHFFCTAGSCNHQVGQAAQECSVKDAAVGRAVFQKTGTVNCKGHVQVLQGNVMHNLVIGPLQKC